ncbi:MAG: copper amine oxidase N-terminal domain-containing protein [Defluviitaleaceae bacterium]|nr:copper amine oxidase N-terminal domain-containing protein [Defluviitaleaceae bacterium]
MKLRFSALLCLLFVLALANAVMAADGDVVQVRVNGTEIFFEGQHPTIVNGRTLVPARGVFAALGYQVDWDGQLRMVTLTGDLTIRLWIDSYDMYVGGVGMVGMDVPPQIIGSSTMIPIRAVSDAIGADVGWLPSERMVTINLRDYRNATFNDLLGFGYSFEQALDIFEQETFLVFNEWRIRNNLAPFVQDAQFAGTNRTWAREAAGHGSDLDAGLITLVQFDQRVTRSFGDAVRAGILGTGYPWRLGTFNDPDNWPIDSALTPQSAADMRLN